MKYTLNIVQPSPTSMSRTLKSPQTETVPIKQKLSISPSSKPLGTTILLSDSKDLTTLGMPYKWKQTEYFLLWLANST